ncbi:MAG TPA: serine/threonine-protein kinase, partial [Roseiflexaceae bacterium]|nr:serine/threonine-protein kinase [Roseiflexaceae bacterium]
MPLNEFAAVGYELLHEIGHGGMGRVFRAREIALDRIVALKVLAAGLNTTAGAGQLFREARNAAALDHPHIVPIYGVGMAGAMPFIAMKYVDGASVEQLASDAPLSLAMVLELIDAAASALDAAHHKGIIHLDVKPANLLLDQHGWLYVSDFGLARASNATIALARSDQYVTPDYVAPEQVRGTPPAPANDIYALG